MTTQCCWRLAALVAVPLALAAPHQARPPVAFPVVDRVVYQEDLAQRLVLAVQGGRVADEAAVRDSAAGR